jgi:hypothetical protein
VFCIQKVAIENIAIIAIIAITDYTLPTKDYKKAKVTRLRLKAIAKPRV